MRGKRREIHFTNKDENTQKAEKCHTNNDILYIKGDLSLKNRLTAPWGMCIMQKVTRKTQKRENKEVESYEELYGNCKRRQKMVRC